MSKIKSVKELILALEVWVLPRKAQAFVTVCVNSCRNSRPNFFFQVINFCLIILLFWFILPNKIESSVNLGSLTGGILGNFVLWVISIILLPIGKIFETSIKVTITIFLVVVSTITFCYIKSLIKVVSALKSRIVYKLYAK